MHAALQLLLLLVPLSLMLCLLIVANVESFSSRSGNLLLIILTSNRSRVDLLNSHLLWIRTASLNQLRLICYVLLLDSPVWVKPLRMSYLAPTLIRVVEIVRSDGELMWIQTPVFGYRTSAIISITILLMAVVSIRLLLNARTCPHILPPRGTVSPTQLHASIVISLQTALFVEGIFEAHAIVRHKRLLRCDYIHTSRDNQMRWLLSRTSSPVTRRWILPG